MKTFKELQESLRSDIVKLDPVKEVTEGFLGKDGEKGRDIKNAGLFDKETAYSLAKKVNGVIHKDPKSDKYHVKHGKGSNVREESVDEASSTSPNMAKAVQGLNDLGYKLKGRDGKDVQRVEKLFRSGNKKVLQGAIRALDTDIRDQIMDILEPLGFVKNGVVEEVDESTAAYAASLEKMASDKKLKGITPKDRETLAKLAAMMKSANEGIEEALEFHVRLDHLDGDKRQKKVTDLLKKHQDAGHISFSGETDKGIVFTSKSKSYIDDVRKDLKPYGVLVDESVDEAASVDPKVAKAVEALNDLGYKLRGRRRFHSGVKRVETFFRSGNKKLLQGAIDVLDPDIRDDVMGILEPLGFVKNGVVEAVDKYTSFSTQNKGRKPSLSQNKLSSGEYQQAKKLKGFNKDDWEWNGDLYIRVEK
jgi:Holliday junction resolvasome RuvABC DNA-binding subunit